MSQRILAIDTSSDACSVALGWGEQIIERFSQQPRKHAELALPMVDEVLAEAGIGLKQLDAIAFGRGPGSFTGLRIAAGVVQGLAFGADLPVVPVSSLAMLAHRAYRENGWQQSHVAVDARMGEVYWGSFVCTQLGSVSLLGRECVSKPEDVAGAAAVQPADGFYGVGSGWVYETELMAATGPLQGCELTLLPHAADLVMLAQSALKKEGATVQAHEVAPVYLRNNVAAKPSANKLGKKQ